MKFNSIYTVLSFIITIQAKTPVYDLQNSQPLNIVIHSSTGGRSHIKAILEISEELSSRGHKVTYATTEDNIRFTKDYNIGNYSIAQPFVDDKVMRNLMKEYVLKKTNEKAFKIVMDGIKDILINNYQLTYEPLKQYLIETQPDLLVCDFFAHPCLDLAKQLAIPLITGLQTTDIFGIVPKPYVTMGFSYLPITTKDMSFSQRLYYQVINQVINLRYMLQAIKNENQVREKFNVPLSNSFIGDPNYGLFVANTFMGFEPAIPLHPNLFQVGPIVSENRDQLSPELSQFLNNNEKTLFIAFGSNSVLNEELTGKVLEAALLAINQNVIDGVVWGLGRTNQDDFPKEVNDDKKGSIKVADLFNGAHPKIKLLSWAPQVSILNHDNTKLFISHGGLESSFEAIYSGTPVVCLALSGDQPRNARKIEDMGTGVYVDKFNFTPESLNDQFKLILEDKNKQFEYNLQRMKTITHHLSKRVNFAADLFEQHTYTAQSCRKFEPYNINSNLPPCEIKHLIPVSNQMSFIKSNNIDIYGATIFLVLLGLVSISTIVYWLCKVIFFVYNDANQLKSKVD